VANFASIYDDLDQAGGAKTVHDAMTLGDAVNLHDAAHKDMAVAATTVLNEGAGATDAALKVILQYLN
jgi:3-deoxy-D-manno-octulosonic-acid transferase